jgi:Fe-S cluster assembly iron-binding protein IscA
MIITCDKGGVQLKVQIDETTVSSIKAFIEENKPEIETLRIHIAGMG